MILTSKSVVARGILSLGDARSLVGVFLGLDFIKNCCLKSSESRRGSSYRQSTTFSMLLIVFCICCAWWLVALMDAKFLFIISSDSLSDTKWMTNITLLNRATPRALIGKSETRSCISSGENSNIHDVQRYPHDFCCTYMALMMPTKKKSCMMKLSLWLGHRFRDRTLKWECWTINWSNWFKIASICRFRKVLIDSHWSTRKEGAAQVVAMARPTLRKPTSRMSDHLAHVRRKRPTIILSLSLFSIYRGALFLHTWQSNRSSISWNYLLLRLSNINGDFIDWPRGTGWILGITSSHAVQLHCWHFSCLWRGQWQHKQLYCRRYQFWDLIEMVQED